MKTMKNLEIWNFQTSKFLILNDLYDLNENKKQRQSLRLIEICSTETFGSFRFGQQLVGLGHPSCKLRSQDEVLWLCQSYDSIVRFSGMHFSSTLITIKNLK